MFDPSIANMSLQIEDARASSAAPVFGILEAA